MKKGKRMPGREIAKGKPNLSRAGFKDFQNNKTRGHSIIPLQIKFQVIDLNSGGGGGGGESGPWRDSKIY